MKMTAKQSLFLKAAIADNNRVWRAGTMSTGFRAGDVFLGETVGQRLLDAGLIEPVKQEGSRNTKKWGLGFEYRLTEAGILKGTE